VVFLRGWVVDVLACSVVVGCEVIFEVLVEVETEVVGCEVILEVAVLGF
jgi:hypothetical protein